jgi:peptidoglycan hydrolase-like protein with peptidoglycan-binding domain
MQGILHEHGYDPGPIDGLMGNKTRAALRQFQLDHQLPVTGYLDPATEAMLFQ